MANDVQEVRIYYSNPQGKRAQNVIHLQANGAPASANPFTTSNILLSAFKTTLETDILQCLCGDTSVDAYTAKRITNSGGPTAVLVGGGTGGVVGNSLSMLVAANLCLLPDNPPFARKEGHIFMPAIPDSFVDADELQAGAFTAYNQFLGDLYNGLLADGATWYPVIFDRNTKAAGVTSTFVVRKNVSGHKKRVRPTVS